MRYNFIAIEGNIGAGKSTLATKIADDFNAKLILEQFEENSFLPKFYKNPDKYAFPLELSFLAERYQQYREQMSLELFTDFTIADYFIGKSLIFAHKTLPKDEYSLYVNLFRIISSSLPKPDLMVYLYMDIDKIQSNIRKRGRDYELDITDEYLKNIQESYIEFINQQKDMRILIIDTNNIDFVENEEDYDKLMDVILNREYEKGIHRITL
ncbi:MAG: deoxynucleoside kinase [Bacteroidota bacterium]|nr:deoxynucleoside kinase [Bacteroidota bacterium]